VALILDVPALMQQAQLPSSHSPLVA
jgi:hypothetical protein